jgi:putative membrane protein
MVGPMVGDAGTAGVATRSNRLHPTENIPMKAVTPLAAAVLALSLAACGPKAEQAADETINTTSETITDVGNAASNALDAAGDALQPTPNGQSFADSAAKSDAFEIAAAKLALTNASSARIKAFANDMIKAHAASTAKIEAAAAKARPAITPDPALTGEQNDDLTDLGKLKGADFDKAYIAGQIDAHDDALELMENFAKDGDVASLKTAASEIIPVVKKHLDMAKALEKP